MRLLRSTETVRGSEGQISHEAKGTTTLNRDRPTLTKNFIFTSVTRKIKLLPNNDFGFTNSFTSISFDVNSYLFFALYFLFLDKSTF